MSTTPSASAPPERPVPAPRGTNGNVRARQLAHDGDRLRRAFRERRRAPAACGTTAARRTCTSAARSAETARASRRRSRRGGRRATDRSTRGGTAVRSHTKATRPPVCRVALAARLRRPDDCDSTTTPQTSSDVPILERRATAARSRRRPRPNAVRGSIRTRVDEKRVERRRPRHGFDAARRRGQARVPTCARRIARRMTITCRPGARRRRARRASAA